MPLSLFEVCCLPIVILTLASLAWVRRERGERMHVLLMEYVALALAGYIGEETCISWYQFYHYAAGWHFRLDYVPLLIVLIWPLFILSGRDVGALFFPHAPAWLATSLLVLFDASLVEVIAVRAGYWSWAEAGHLAVPIIGILGWSFFAVGASVGLARRSESAPLRAPLSTIAFAFVSTHVLIFGAWWTFFRFTVRGDLGLYGFVPLVALALVGLGFVVRGSTRAHARAQEAPFASRPMRLRALLRVVFPRLTATGLFVLIAARTVVSWRDPLLAHIAIVAVTYSIASLLYLYVRVERKTSAVPEVGADEERHDLRTS